MTALSCRAPADGFVFDSEVIAQMAAFGFRIAKIPVETRYFREASSIRLFASCRYGLETLLTLVKFLLHRLRLRSFPQFQQ